MHFLKFCPPTVVQYKTKDLKAVFVDVLNTIMVKVPDNMIVKINLSLLAVIRIIVFISRFRTSTLSENKGVQASLLVVNSHCHFRPVLE